jgi:hypothetical protein
MKGPLIYYELKDMYGTDLSSTKLATELRQSILEEIDLGFNVEVDFKGVRSVSNGWARNALGLIVRDKGDKFFRDHILLSNVDKYVRTNILEGVSQVIT